MEINDRLKEERKRLGLTQQSVADIGGIGLKTQRRYEINESQPDTRYLAALMKAGFDMIYIMSGKREGDAIEELLKPHEVDLLDTYRALSGDDQSDMLHYGEALLGRAVREGRSDYIVRKEDDD